MAMMMQKTSFVARPQPRLARGPRAAAPRALALDRGSRPSNPVQRLIDSLLGKAPARDNNDMSDDDIPPEYRAAAGQGSHGGSWKHSHIADRMAKAGGEDAH